MSIEIKDNAIWVNGRVPKVGDWYESERGRICIHDVIQPCCGKFVSYPFHVFEHIQNEMIELNLFTANDMESYTHLPDCDSWDWQPAPQPDWQTPVPSDCGKGREVEVRDKEDREWSSFFSRWDSQKFKRHLTHIDEKGSFQTSTESPDHSTNNWKFCRIDRARYPLIEVKKTRACTQDDIGKIVELSNHPDFAESFHDVLNEIHIKKDRTDYISYVNPATDIDGVNTYKYARVEVCE